MSAKYKDYPIYSYDEPAIYDDFTGGINTDPSNEHLLKNELRDCINMTYLSGALVKRKGAKQIAMISCEDTLKTIQGVFLFSYKLTYLIIAADGKLYYGIYNPNTNIIVKRLHINYTYQSTLQYDPTNPFVGLEEYSYNVSEQHDGYLRNVLINISKLEQFEITDRGSWEDYPTNAGINTYDMFEYKAKTYVYMGEPIEKTVIVPTNTKYWEPFSDDTSNLYVEDWYETDTKTWPAGCYIKYENTYYRCKLQHNNYSHAIVDPDLFVNTYYGTYNNDTYKLGKELYFQNYKKIEGATLNNKLYLATGTRIVEVGFSLTKTTLDPEELTATPVSPSILNMSEVINIGYNYMSPYPEFCLGTQLETVTTSIRNVLPIKDRIKQTYTLTPIMSFQYGEDSNSYLYRWEKYIDGVWYVVKTFCSQDIFIKTSNDTISQNIKYPSPTLEVTDADKYMYRVTFAKQFEHPSEYISDWDSSLPYTKGDFVYANNKVYKCLINTSELITNTSNRNFSEYGYKSQTINGEETQVQVLVWEEVFELEELKTYALDDTNNEPVISKVYDYKIDKVTGSYFGSATSLLAKDLEINDTFKVIHSCTKVHIDGNKLLFYGDSYNSGQWFKTIINNPGYITDRGCLSFKTTKNEAVIKVTSFQGNIIIFANSETAGGSIHIVTGNGDDYNAEDGYYSPYKRSTINSKISCDNPDTVQICDNILVFKYFNRVYYIDASDLSNEVIQVTSCNDRLLHNSTEVIIPWEDNNCISEVTDTYYGLIWKEKYYMDDNGEIILEHPAIKLKMYYKMANRLPDNSYTFPWLRDESSYFNITDIIYIKGQPVYLYNNLLISFMENNYKDLNNNYECKIHLRGVDLNYPKLYKIISNVIVYYHRNQYSKVTFDTTIKNEAGHLIIDPSKKVLSLQDYKVLQADTSNKDSIIRLDSTILDTKVLNPSYHFPCLLADTIITSTNEGEFSLSSITFNYSTVEAPESNPYDLYSNILRMKGVR